MVRNRLAGAAVSVLCLLAASCASNQTLAVKGLDLTSHARVTEGFDADWRFKLGDTTGADQPVFDDSAWRALDVPHDWSIEGAIDEHSPSGKSEAFLPAGIGWYRKHFTVSQDLAGRAFFIEFDGVLANSDIWINGVHLGRRPYGYVSFSYELTGHLNFGAQDNVLAVRCDNSLQPASRWYSGYGIYRHVRLVAERAVHLARYSPYITTPKISDARATVHVHTTVVNESRSPRQVLVGTIVFDPAGKPIAADPTNVREIPPGATVGFDQDIYVPKPKRWDIDQPNLYRAVTQVMDGDVLADNTSTSFGIREFHFSPDTGFWLNGRNFKLFGCALHADGGAVGAAVPLGVWERRLALLKTVGCNAIRTAHNPPAPEFLDLCDRMGFLVMDEMFDVWTVGKTPLRSRTVLADYHLYFKDWWRTDVTDTVERDRNHPSIVLWSAGNEIHDISANSDLGFRLFVPLRDLYHQLDPTRPVTLAVVRPNGSRVYDNGFADLMDVVGQNYRENELEAAHAARPSRKILGTENRQDVATWLHLRDDPALSGQFLWTGVDYMGESPRWPIISSSAGLFDRTLVPKATAYQRASWWTSLPVVHIARILPPLVLAPAPALEPGMDAGAPPQPRRLSDWTVRDAPGHIENVEVYTNCARVELFLNGQSLGAQNRHADDSPLTWKVAYQPGELTAVAHDDEGASVATQTLHTAGPAAKIELSADQQTLPATWDSVSFVRANVVDADGFIVPDAGNLITFQISGPGRIAAVDNGDPLSHEAFAASQRSAFRGRCLAIVKATGAGPIAITASAANLLPATVQITGSAE